MALASIRIDADLVERAQRGNAAGRRLTWKTFASKAGIWKRFPNKNTVVKNGTLPPGKVRCTCHGRLSGGSRKLRIDCSIPVVDDSRCFLLRKVTQEGVTELAAFGGFDAGVVLVRVEE